MPSLVIVPDFQNHKTLALPGIRTIFVCILGKEFLIDSRKWQLSMEF
jgi:hypothetical protein